MKKLLFCLITAFSIGNLGTAYADSDNSFMDYKIDTNKFAIIYIEKETVSSKEAKEKAIARAAQVAHDNGYRYFIIEKEQQVRVSQSQTPQNPFPGNAYEEAIIEQNFDKESLQRNAPRTSNLYPGFKITIKGLKDNSTGVAHDTCKWVKCK